MFWYVHWNAATVALEFDFFIFLKESYDHFYNSAYDSAAWKNNEKTTVQAQKSEQAVKILQHSRLQAAAGKWAQRSSQEGGETGYLWWNRTHKTMTFPKLEANHTKYYCHFKKDTYFRIQTSPQCRTMSVVG